MIEPCNAGGITGTLGSILGYTTRRRSPRPFG